MNTQELAEKLSRTQHLFQFRGYSSPTDCAQDQLTGRTHYADPYTLRFFKSRILSARPEHEGICYRITESCALDPDNTRRGYRVVLFDLFGSTIYRPELQACRRTRESAEKDYSAWAKAFDPVDYYRQTLANKADNMTAKAQALREIFETVEAE